MNAKEKVKSAYDALMKWYPLTPSDLPGEIWKPVSDYDKYEVSNFGRIKSFNWNKIKILKPFINGKGYLCIRLYKEKNQSQDFRVHRLVAELFIPNPENKPQINHIDGCKLNNHVSNLEWATQSENMRHAIVNGLKIAPQGEESKRAKLTNEQARYIRENPDSLNTVELAKMFNVVPATISNIQQGRGYSKSGGRVRQAKHHPSYVSSESRVEIRRQYVYGSREFGCYALAKKYGICPQTIWRIIREEE